MDEFMLDIKFRCVGEGYEASLTVRWRSCRQLSIHALVEQQIGDFVVTGTVAA